MVHKVDQMNKQVDKIKEEFAKRLQQSMDLQNYPTRGRARVLSKEFGISDKAASKWLNGEAIPETSKLPILAKFLGTTSEWLLSGDNLKFECNNASIKYDEVDINTLYETFISDLDRALKSKKLTSEILITLNKSLNLMTK